MRLPRDVSGRELAKAAGALRYQISRQTGSHIRLTTTRNGEHHITIPAHDALKIGTLAAILGNIAAHLELDRDEVTTLIFPGK
ncbi:MAG: type II toxin-antitoxin system HicA family toxin [Proteobacteria bacterium]|nr:type II toxin-antitoxin system HicA family toxin [Pseudomonadota bacterium]